MAAAAAPTALSPAATGSVGRAGAQTAQWDLDLDRDSDAATGATDTPITTGGERFIHAIQVVSGGDTHTHPSSTWALTTLP